MGYLYIVSTPIGNLADMTFRGVEVLKQVRLIAAEDTRKTRTLLQHFEIKTAMIAYHEHNELMDMEKILEELKKGDVALVSDAGTPGVSDPGFKLIREAIDRGFEVVPIPGANAILPALVASGLPTDSFSFLGFLPKKQAGRIKVLERVKEDYRSLVMYESPNRIYKALVDVLEVLGDRQVCVAREMTKKFETFERGKVSQILESWQGKKVIGEIVLVVAGISKDEMVWNEDRVMEALKHMRGEGVKLSNAAKTLAKESGWSRKDIYQLGVESED